MLLHTQHLDESTLDALDALLARCQQVDGHGIAIYRDLLAEERPTPSTLLYYKNNQLIGFTAVFFFEHNQGEIALLVDPAYRKQGIAHTLLKTMLLLIEDDRPVTTLCFSTPHGVHDTTLIKQGFHYLSSEYAMKLNLQGPIPPAIPLTLRVAEPADIPTLSYLDSQCFPAGFIQSEARFHTLFARPEYTIFLALQENTVVGKAHVAWHEKAARLSDIGILPTKQHQGLGRSLIIHCLNYALTLPKTEVTLSVETHNQHALHLYQNLGFTLSSAIDYWSCPFVDQLKRTTAYHAKLQ